MPVGPLLPRCGASRTHSGSPWTASTMDSCALTAASLSCMPTRRWALASTSSTYGRCASPSQGAGTLKPRSRGAGDGAWDLRQALTAPAHRASRPRRTRSGP